MMIINACVSWCMCYCSVLSYRVCAKPPHILHQSLWVLGGGLKHGSIVQVDDQAQHFKVSLVVSHQVGLRQLLCTNSSSALFRRLAAGCHAVIG